MLRSAAAQADNDALAQGELVAIKSKAASRLGELDGIIKAGVDAGTIPHVRAPAFERGFRSRVGSELAQSSFQEALLSQLPDVSQVSGTADDSGNPLTHQQRVEKVVSDAYSKYSGQLHPDDIYAKTAFDQVAQGVIAGFRQRAVEAYTSNYKAAGEQAIADDNSERVLNLATAPESDLGLYRSNVKEGLDQIRAELPKGQVNQFYLKSVVEPAVAKLISQRKFTEARNVLDEMGTLDVTGNGGLLGQTAVGKTILSDLHSKVEREQRINGEEEWTALHRGNDVKKYAGELAAGKDLLTLRTANTGHLLDDKRFEMIDTFRAAHADDPLAVSAYAETVNREYENESKFRSDPRKLSDLEVGIKSLRKDDIAKSRSMLEALYNLHEIAPSDRTRLAAHLDKLDALYGAYDESDVNRFKKDLYATSAGSGLPPTINFGDGLGGGGNPRDPNSTGKLWDSLPPGLKEKHESLVTEFFQRAVEDDLVNRVGDPNRVPAEKAKTLDNATTKSRAYALTLLRDLSAVKEKQKVAQEIAKQAKAIQQAASIRRDGAMPTLEYAATRVVQAPAGDVPGDLPGPAHTEVFLKTYELPQADGHAMALDFGHKPAESDVGVFRAPGDTLSQFVNLEALGKDAASSPDKYLERTAREAYGYIKSSLGFTPEEIVARKTKHGVEFNPAEIDPTRISVFRDVSELNKLWNNGQPTDLFFSIGDAIDTKDRLTSRAFYLAQRALLTPR